jgi:hypothetical protein
MPCGWSAVGDRGRAEEGCLREIHPGGEVAGQRGRAEEAAARGPRAAEKPWSSATNSLSTRRRRPSRAAALTPGHGLGCRSAAAQTTGAVMQPRSHGRGPRLRLWPWQEGCRRGAGDSPPFGRDSCAEINRACLQALKRARKATPVLGVYFTRGSPACFRWSSQGG